MSARQHVNVDCDNNLKQQDGPRQSRLFQNKGIKQCPSDMSALFIHCVNVSEAKWNQQAVFFLFLTAALLWRCFRTSPVMQSVQTKGVTRSTLYPGNKLQRVNGCLYTQYRGWPPLVKATRWPRRVAEQWEEITPPLADLPDPTDASRREWSLWQIPN